MALRRERALEKLWICRKRDCVMSKQTGDMN